MMPLGIVFAKGLDQQAPGQVVGPPWTMKFLCLGNPLHTPQTLEFDNSTGTVPRPAYFRRQPAA